MMNHRQHHPKGQTEIRDLIQSHLPFPLECNSTEAFPYMIYMAQIMQAMGQKTESEFYRRLMDKLDESDGTGHNMGALYWQLNDIWEGCSWASFGKMMYDISNGRVKYSIVKPSHVIEIFRNHRPLENVCVLRQKILCPSITISVQKCRR